TSSGWPAPSVRDRADRSAIHRTGCRVPERGPARCTRRSHRCRPTCSPPPECSRSPAQPGRNPLPRDRRPGPRDRRAPPAPPARPPAPPVPADLPPGLTAALPAELDGLTSPDELGSAGTLLAVVPIPGTDGSLAI